MSQSASQPYSRLTHLGDIPVETFLKEYWQKKPLLIRQCFPHFSSPVSADELAGFALDEDVTSRLVVEHQSPGGSRWEVTHGPLPESQFAKLPEKNWTLLVQHADALDPDINQLLNAFRFIPNWRLDDIMVSYAADGGGVGPHFDYYDVFLLQAEGKRRWRIGQTCSTQTALLPDQPMKILREFEQAREWLLEPGDMLYLPPMLAHWGIAEGNCMTYSIGFRAPSHADILLDFAQEAASHTTGDMRYSDPALPLQNHSGEISLMAIENVSRILQQYLTDKVSLAQWLGETLTQPKTPFAMEAETITEDALRNNAPFRLNPFTRGAFFDCSALGEASDRALLFVDGFSYRSSRHFSALLTGGETILFNNLDSIDRKVAMQLAELALLVSGTE